MSDPRNPHKRLAAGRHCAYNREMISEGDQAPGFSLKDQFGRDVSLSDFTGRRHALLVFYPLDWTPT